MNKVAICAHPSKKNLTWLINFYFKNHFFFLYKKGGFCVSFLRKDMFDIYPNDSLIQNSNGEVIFHDNVNAEVFL